VNLGALDVDKLVFVGQLLAALMLNCALVLPLWYLVKTGNLKSAVLLMWGGLFLWSVSASMLIPLSIIKIVDNDANGVFAVFPEMTIILPVVVTGWMSSLILCSVLLGLRKLILYCIG